MIMKIKDHLSKNTKRNLDKLNTLEKKERERRETEDLMGMRRDRYERRGGAVRRK